MSSRAEEIRREDETLPRGWQQEGDRGVRDGDEPIAYLRS